MRKGLEAATCGNGALMEGEGSEFPSMLYHLVILKRAAVIVAIIILCCDRLLSDYDFGPSQ